MARERGLLLVLVALALLSACALPARAAEEGGAVGPAVTAVVRVDAANVLRTTDRKLLIGSNVAMWNNADLFTAPRVRELVRDMGPGLIRVPGGSWADVVYWNGHGVRDADGNVDHSRVKDGWPTVDYSGPYEPSFLMENVGIIREGQWHGNVDVKTLHEFIEATGAETLVTVNAGTGRALDAAEWARWAGKQGYHVRYWEVGNELGGSWEAGHYLPDGTELNGQVFAPRYADFARAMKAVDPAAKVGCMDWVPDVLAQCGDVVDFVSWHIYPLNGLMTEEEMLATAERSVASLTGATARWLDQYQPDRKDEVEIGVTEWHPAGREVSNDLFGGLWTALFVGEMFRDGVDFATQWDMLTAWDAHRGAALIVSYDPAVLKAQCWAFWLWNHYMADSMVAVTKDGPESLRVFATKDDAAVYVMAINPSRRDEVQARVVLDGFEAAPEGERAVLAHRGYFWDYLTGHVLWGRGPEVSRLPTGGEFSVTLPPLSITCLRVPGAATPALTDAARAARTPTPEEAGEPELRFLMPTQGYADTPMEGWVLAFRKGTDEPYPLPLEPAELSVEGTATTDRPRVRLAEAAGQFTLIGSAPGRATVTARLGEQEASVAVELLPTVPRPYVFWEFEGQELGPDVTTDWSIALDGSMRPNQNVVRADLAGVVRGQGGQCMLRVGGFPGPDQLKRENIRGVVFDLLVPEGFECAGPDASVEVVMQSTRNYWMVLGRIPLAGLPRGEWTHHEVPVTDERLIQAMPDAYNIWFNLQNTQPATGALYFDSVGLLVR